jgi:predicted aminopeptidase
VREQAHYIQVIDLLRRTRSELNTLYISGVDRDEMRQRKKAAFDAMRDSFEALNRQWGGAPFESWFKGDLNNAHLASIATYYDCVPGFQRELESVHGDLEAFYRRVRELAALNQATRDAAVCARP